MIKEEVLLLRVKKRALKSGLSQKLFSKADINIIINSYLREAQDVMIHTGNFKFNNLGLMTIVKTPEYKTTVPIKDSDERKNVKVKSKKNISFKLDLRFKKKLNKKHS